MILDHANLEQLLNKAAEKNIFFCQNQDTIMSKYALFYARILGLNADTTELEAAVCIHLILSRTQAIYNFIYLNTAIKLWEKNTAKERAGE